MYFHVNKGPLPLIGGKKNNADISFQSKRLELSLSVFVCVQVESRLRGDVAVRSLFMRGEEVLLMLSITTMGQKKLATLLKMEGTPDGIQYFSSNLFRKSLPARGFVSFFATIQKGEVARIFIPRKGEVE
jgi:hypothetical protein